MKQDFEIANNELNQRGIVAVCRDVYMQPKRRGNNYFVKSPVSADKTWSLCLYPSSNRYCDFANGNHNGDIISFATYIKNINQWQALKELQAYYGLTTARQQDKEKERRRIQLQQLEERQRKERKRAFETALISCVCDLKHNAEIYEAAIRKDGFVPFSDEWCYCVDKLNMTAYRLDILCGIGTEYLRLKPDIARGIPSGHPQWLLDNLAVLGARDMFSPTDEEIKEIKAQRDFELTRGPGKDREFLLFDWWH